ncbi:unnamed protein product, partial [Brenthis ino]
MSVSEIVKSVGDSWIICRSKTYSGRIYYFNTFSGKAVWNLSEPEMEKAKKMTKVLENQPHFFNDNCPEPSESPQDNQIVQSTSKQEQPSSKIIPSNVYNEQIINNRFPKLNSIQFTPYNQLTPVQFNIPVTPFYSGIGNVTAQPIIVNPANVNQSHPVINNFGYVPTKTSIPLSNRFKSLSEEHTQSNILQTKAFYSKSNTNGYTRKTRHGFSKKYFHRNKNNPAHNNDLRMLLTSKRRSFTKKEIEGCTIEHYEEKSGSSLHVPYNLRSNVMDDNDDDYWLEENMHYQTSMEAINTTLRNILQVNNFEPWYIVTDSNVFLNHVNFINFLMKSDTKCRLLIPRIVMNKLQNATNSRLRTQAHRAAYFISQKVDNNYAIIDDGDTNENVNYKDAILKCCLKLIEQGNRVVLLTDDIELHSCESSISIYTVMEVKRMLNNPTLHEIIPKSPENLSSKANRNIKITIPNDNSTINLKETETIDVNAGIEDNSVFFQTEALPSVCKGLTNACLKNISNEQNLLIEKEIDDVGVHTDSIELDTREENPNINTWQDVANQTSCNTEFNKKKGIKLKRQSSFDIASKSNNSTKKQFKWRKRRTKSSLSMVSETSVTEDDQTIDDIINKETESNANKLSPNFFRCTESMGSIFYGNNQNDSETSSFVNRNVPENFNVKRTPTVIPNNENTKEIVSESKKYEDVNDDGHVMFVVTSQAMENNLKIKCDEWISRFVQIMEEVLTQVLQIDPPYVLDTMPPPWNIYEAVECVKRKFSNINDVIDAATKLSDVLFEIGGLRGKIKADISPNKYMEMYSYGVYLIDTLQGSLSNVEDLHIAEQSLSKLLRDIQDPHLDPSNQDLFGDISTDCQKSQIEESVRNTSIETVEPNIDNKNTSGQTEYSSPTTKSSNYTASPSTKVYHLRSHRKKKLLQEMEDIGNEVTFIRNIDLEASFFTSLHLKKNPVANENIEILDTVVDELPQINENDIESLKTDNNLITNDNQKELSSEDNKVNSEPKIIRNFTKCFEFEEKLKNIPEGDLEQDNWYSQSESDYAVDEELENEGDEFFYENHYDDYEYNDQMYDSNNDDNESGAVNDLQCENNENLEKKDVNFKFTMGKIEDNIKKTFLAIHGFCVKSCETLSSSDDSVQKTNIQELAEKTFSHVNSLCDALSSILSRETSDCLYRIQELLRMDNINENVIHDLDLEGYRNFIRKCLEKGTILKDSVKLVIEASKE